MGALSIPASEFWRLTLREFWAIYYGRLGREKTEEPLTVSDILEMEKIYSGYNA